MTLEVAKEAVMKCFAASWSMAIVLAGPPLPPAPVQSMVLADSMGNSPYQDKQSKSR